MSDRSRPREAGALWRSEAVALFLKDARAELRSKVAISAIGVFSLTSLLLIALATATLKEKFIERNGVLSPAWDSAGKMGLLWVLLCFAAFAGLSHSFVQEEEAGTYLALRLSISSGAVYAGKLAFNFVLIALVATVTIPLYMLITGMAMASPCVFLSVILGGCLGLAAAATITAALAAKARSTGALFGAIGLPIIVVFLLLLLNAAQTLYKVGLPAVQVTKDIGGLYSFAILLIAVSALTFPYVWED